MPALQASPPQFPQRERRRNTDSGRWAHRAKCNPSVQCGECQPPQDDGLGPLARRLDDELLGYGQEIVAINNHDYMLPVGAQVILRRGHKETDLNEIEFRNFRRFGSNVKILDSIQEVKT